LTAHYLPPDDEPLSAEARAAGDAGEAVEAVR